MKRVPALLALASGLLCGQTGVITTIAGTGERGFSGDNGPAVNARIALADLRNPCDPGQFEQTSHITVDRDGNIYFTDSANHRVRRITPQGTISTVIGSGERPTINAACDATGPNGDGGTATAARLYNPADVVLHPSGLIVVDELNNRIRQVAGDGRISSIVGSGQHQFYAPNVPALLSGMDWPSAATVGPDGLVYFIELHSNRVARIAPDGRLVTVAGGVDPRPGFGGDDGAATGAGARFFYPTGLAFDASGNLYIADQGNHRVRRVTPGGVLSTFAGNGTPGFSGDDGQARQAALNRPADVKADAAGNVYIADMGNHRIRRVSPSGVITTVAGDGRIGRGPDGVAATASSLNFPLAVAIDAAGDLYILDWQNFLIRKVSFNPRPAISAGGVVNGASFAPAPIPVAPGAIISIFGLNLAPATAIAAAVPLPTELAGASVRINGVPAPLFFVSAGQINAQVPFGLAAGTATAVIRTPAGESAPETFNVAATAPGIFQFPGTNRAVVLNQDNSVNGPENPEEHGRILVVFLTGQGPVNPPVPTGEAASFTQLSPATLPASASIGRVPADIKFLGLTPGFVGLAQANIEVPAGAPTGSEVVLFLTIDRQTSNTATVSIR